MGNKNESTRLAVIGAGPAGYAAAFLGADLGLDTVLIDPEPNPGGVCLFRGCIPSKALLHVADTLERARQAAECGISFADPEIDRERLRAWKDGVVERLTGGLGDLAKRRGIRRLRGRARFLDGGTLQVDTADGTEGLRLSFQDAILATGSRPGRLPFLPRSDRVMDSTGALALREIPQRLLVIGGGYIGLELGTVYAALGSRVTVVEMTGSLLPGVDPDLVRPLARRLEGRLESVRLETRVVSAEETRDGLSVTFEGDQAPDGPQTFDRVLVSVGRKPNTEDLGLDRTRAKIGEDGFVEADAQQRTGEPSIYAVGDVAGQPMLAHKGSHQGRTAAEVIAGRHVSFAPRAIPAVVFTDPEIAWCGLTEAEAKQQNRKVQVARFPWSASGRARTLGRPEGVTKLLLDPESERVLGVGIAGSGAGELISEGVLAVEMGALAADLSLCIHPHPTLSETLMEAAEVFFGLSTHVYRPRRSGKPKG